MPNQHSIMCKEPATRALKELVDYVNSKGEILLITQEVDEVAPGAYDHLHSLLQSKTRAHVHYGSYCGQIDVFSDGALSLRSCTEHRFKKGGDGDPVGKKICPRGLRSRGLRSRGLRSHIGLGNRRQRIVHPVENVIGSGTHVLNCPKTEGAFLSLEARITRDEDDVTFQIDRFSVRNKDDCKIYLNKWILEVCILNGQGVHKLRPEESRDETEIRGSVGRTYRVATSLAANPVAPASVGVNASRTTIIERNGILRSWATGAARTPQHGAALSWSTQLWMQHNRRVSTMSLDQNLAVRYFQGDNMADALTVSMEPHNPGASFKTTGAFGASSFPRAKLKAKLTAHLRGSRKIYNAYRLVEVEQEFEITNVF